MAGDGNASPLKKDALLAFESGQQGASDLLAQALKHDPNDGALLIAQSACLLRERSPEPFSAIKRTLDKHPDWVEGHKALSKLKSEAGAPNPLSSIEDALEKLPKHPRLWMGYLTLLGSAGRHSEAAQKTAQLRQSIGDLPVLRIVEARHRGFAGEAKVAQSLLEGLPPELPELGFELARNTMRLGDFETASVALAELVTKNPEDIGAWALLELCWRVLDHPRHKWLCPSAGIYDQFDLGLSKSELCELTDSLRNLHVTRSAPLGQSVEGGTQTHGDLKLRSEPAIRDLFERIEHTLARYALNLPQLAASHPLALLQSRTPEICASWSILLTSRGRHVPHLHDGGRISSAVHIAVPENLKEGEGELQLGLPPEDIPLQVKPLASFKPRPGHLVLFPSFLYHSTSRFFDGERLTVAFDAV